MYKSVKRRFPNIQIGTPSKSKVAKSVPKGTTPLREKQDIPKGTKGSKFPTISKDLMTSSQYIFQSKELGETPGYFANILKKYEAETDMHRLFFEFKIFNQRARSYYTNYRLYQLQTLTKKHHHVMLPEEEKENQRILLLLDMDETLIHSDVKRNKESDVRIEFASSIPGQSNQKSVVFISLRPHLYEFLEKIKQCGLFEIGIFTAGSRGYAQAIINHFDPERKYIPHRIFRDNCIQLPQCIFAKDLRIFKNRSLNNILLVDNSPFCFANRRNGIPILSYEGNENDKELLHLLEYLLHIGSAPETAVKKNHEYFMGLS